MNGHADGAGLIGDGARHRLANPPGGVGRELEAAAPVELLDGTVQSDHALLDQVEQGQVASLVALRDRNDEAEVAVDHPLLRRGVAALDPLRQRDLLGRGQQREAAGPVHEQGQRVDRAGQLGVGGRDRDGLLELGLDDLDLAGLELGPEGRELFLVEVVLERDRLESGLVDRPALLGLREKRLNWSFKHRGTQFCSLPSFLGVSSAAVDRGVGRNPTPLPPHT